MFKCFYPGPASFNWFIDMKRVTDTKPPPNVTVGPRSNPLTILALSLYNNSVIKCRAETEEQDEQFLFSNKSSLVVYCEYLKSVQFFFLRLNICYTDIEPNILTSDDDPQSLIVDWSGQVFTSNITFDVHITRMTLGSSQIFLFKEIRNLVNMHYRFTSLNHSVCDRFSFTVTPTEGGRRGISSQPVTGFFTQARGE